MTQILAIQLLHDTFCDLTWHEAIPRQFMLLLLKLKAPFPSVGYSGLYNGDSSVVFICTIEWKLEEVLA